MDKTEDLEVLRNQMKKFQDEGFATSKGFDALKATASEDYDAEITSNKQLRKDIDEVIQRVVSLPKSRERSLSITKLEEAVMWLGMDLKRLGTTNPYPNSKDPDTGSKIDPTADGLKFSN